ncbi:MAG: hypothetical protein ACREB8_03820 [Pseudolabrys sp.]
MILVSMDVSSSPARAGLALASNVAPNMQPNAAQESIRRLNLAAESVRFLPIIRTLTPL